MKANTHIVEIMLLNSLLSIFTAGAFGAFGAIVHYLYTLVKEDAQYSLRTMLVFMIMGFFVSLLVNSILMDMFGRTYEGALLLSGFLVLRILDFLDDNGLSIGLQRLGIKTPHQK